MKINKMSGKTTTIQNPTTDEVFVLPKQYRYEEDAYQRKHWTKKILDIESGTILGRTTHQWILLVLYLICFYVLLMLLWAMCFWVFISNIDMKRPRCIIAQPGLTLIPTISTIPTRIVFQNKEEESIGRISEIINNTLKKFGPIPVNFFTKCQPNHDYGFQSNKPCIFLKINRSIGFVTKPYMNTSELPPDASKELINYIDKIPYKNRTSRIWIQCTIQPKINISYYPNPYVETKHITLSKKRAKKRISHSNSAHSFYDKRDYNRIIAVKFSEVVERETYKFSCSMWAKNIVRLRDGINSRGIVYGTIEVRDHEEFSNDSPDLLPFYKIYQLIVFYIALEAIININRQRFYLKYIIST